MTAVTLLNLIVGGVYATDTNMTIENNTDLPLNVVVYDSDHYDCKLPGQNDTYNCGNGDGNIEQPGALNVQVIQPKTNLDLVILQDGINAATSYLTRESSLHIGLRPNGNEAGEYHITMWSNYPGNMNGPSDHYDGIASYNLSSTDTGMCYEGYCQTMSISTNSPNATTSLTGKDTLTGKVIIN